MKPISTVEAVSQTSEERPDQAGAARLTSMAARILRVYRERDAVHGNDLFKAPAWEILLWLQHLHVGLTPEELGELIELSPPATQRWIDLLVSRDLLAIIPGPLGAEPCAQTEYTLTEKAKKGFATALEPALGNPLPSRGSKRPYETRKKVLQVRRGTLRPISGN